MIGWLTTWRRRSCGIAGCLAVLGVTAGVVAGAERGPNIVLCMGDDHAWDETGYNGHPHLRTPVLDDMAATGLRFDRFYSASPVCSPTRGSVLTGRHPNRYGTFSANWSVRPEEITIAQILSQAGYVCGHFGKWHVGPVKADSPVNPGALGFSQWLSHDNFFEMDPVLSRNGGPPEQFHGESSELLIEEAIRFIGQARQNGQPFFVVVWFGSPHEPYRGLDADLALYDKVPELYSDRQVTLTSLDTGTPVKRPLGEVLRERYAEITAMDRALGRLRTYLTETGLKRDTLLWYCGDNGIPASGRATTPFRAQKGAVYEGGVRVPGVLEWPARVAKPRTTDVPAVTSDMLPTLCEIVEQPVPTRPLDGISLLAVMDGTRKQRPVPICFWNFNPSRERGNKPYLDPALQAGTTPLAKKMGGRFTRDFQNFHHPVISESDYVGPRAILDGHYKLVLEGQPQRKADPAAPSGELFDLTDDPAEQHNLMRARPEIAARLARQLRAWQESVLQSLTGADY